MPSIVEEAESKFFRSKHSSLKPLFRKLNESLVSLGPDVRAYIKTVYIGYVSVDLFALIFVRPVGFLDVGLSLPKNIQSDRLTDAKKMGFKQITKSIELMSEEELDGEVLEWLKIAYQGVVVEK